MTFCIGLTGNIATGKSTVAKEFKKLGIQIINADLISRDLTNTNTEAYHAIVKHFSKSILLEDKSLDRKKLKEIIFSNAKEKKWLEELLHPLIRQSIKKRIDSSTSPYTMVEIPLIFDPKDYPYIKRVLLVTTSHEQQLDRLKNRDNLSNELCKKILNLQPSKLARLKMADDILENQADISTLLQKIKELHQYYLKLAQRCSLKDKTG